MPLGRILGHSERSCVMPRRGPPHRKLTITAGGGLASALQVRIGDQLDRRLEGDFSRMRLAIGLSPHDARCRSEEHTSELQSLMRISYAVFCLKKKKLQQQIHIQTSTN